MKQAETVGKWLTPGIGVKRWLILLMVGVAFIAAAFALAVVAYRGVINVRSFVAYRWTEILLIALVGVAFMGISMLKLTRNLLAPYRPFYQKTVIDAVYTHSRRQKGPKVVAIGGGTGMPSALKGLKGHTSNLTAVVTVADDGGSSGRLRRDLGVLPPGDLRNNIAALADDENLMTQLFQYRFKDGGDLDGHAFGNLFISALSGVTGSLESALIETERVLNIQGRVLPATLHDVHLSADVLVNGEKRTVTGESNITAAGGRIEQVSLNPADVQAYHGSIQAILDADIVVIGPGSLYTSILPNLLVKGIADALRATSASKIYICNIAMQPGETDTFTVADHVLALEKHVGQGLFHAVLANDARPTMNAGVTRYVQPAHWNHEIMQRYTVIYADLVDAERPWRHSPEKLVAAILALSEAEKPRARQTLATLTQSH